MCERVLYFPYGDGVNRSLFFEIFSFEICADPFALVGAGGWEEFNLFKSAAMGSQSRLYLFEIAGMVGSYFYITARLEAAAELLYIGRAEETSLVVASFGPRVREIDMEAFHGVSRYEVG